MVLTEASTQHLALSRISLVLIMEKDKDKKKTSCNAKDTPATQDFLAKMPVLLRLRNSSTRHAIQSAQKHAAELVTAVLSVVSAKMSETSYMEEQPLHGGTAHVWGTRQTLCADSLPSLQQKAPVSA